MAPRSLPCLFACAVAVAACGEIPEPESFAIATTTTVADEAAEVDGPEVPAAAVQSDSPVTTEFVPSRSEDYTPAVLLSTRDDVLTSTIGGVLIPLDGSFADLSTDRAVDDLLGGLVVQQRSFSPTSGPGSVLWYRAEGGEPIVIDDVGGQLLDVGYVGGSPSAVVLVGENQLDRIRLVDNERTVMFNLADDEQVLGLSASGGFNAVVVANERCGELRFYAADGSRIGMNGPDEPDCIVPRRPEFRAVALSPAGGAMVYTRVTYRDDGIEDSTELVARDLTDGTEYFRRRIGEGGDRITAISFDGERVAYLRESDESVSVTVLDLTTEAEVPLPLDDVAALSSLSFARLPLAGS